MNTRHYDPDKLKDLREAKGLTQEQAASRLNVHRQTIFRAEAGSSASYDLLCSMCALYGEDVVVLLRRRPVEVGAA